MNQYEHTHLLDFIHLFPIQSKQITYTTIITIMIGMNVKQKQIHINTCT